MRGKPRVGLGALLAQLLVAGVSSVQQGIWKAPTMPSDSGAYRGRS